MGDPKAFLNIPRRNGRMHYTGENGRRHTKYCRLLAIFLNLQDVFVLLFARNRVC